MSEETTIDASTPVTGQSRMDAAWGSDSSDVATVAKPVTQTGQVFEQVYVPCLLYTSPSPRDLSTSRMPSSA